MKENSNWQVQHRQDRLRPNQKRFSYPYPEIVSAKQSPANTSFNKKHFVLLDKENCKTMDLRFDRKKTISPERKKPSGTKRRLKRNQHNQLGELNKTQELRRVIPSKSLRVPSSGSHPDFIKGKSAESKRQRRLEWEDKQQRELSLSLKKRSLSKELRKIIYQDHRERSRPKRPATQLTRQNATLKPENVPLMRDILRQIKKQSENVRQRKDSVVDQRKIKKDRKKSLETNQLSKNVQNISKTIHTTSSKQRIQKKKRISTVAEDIKDIPNSQSEIYKQSPLQNNNVDAELEEIEQVHLTEADQFDLHEFRQFQHKFFNNGVQKNEHRIRHPSAELLDQMARKIQRWWRRHRTKKIVNHFLRFTVNTTSPALSERFAKTQSAESQQGRIKKSDQEELRFHQDDVRKITHISNLSNEEEQKEHIIFFENIVSEQKQQKSHEQEQQSQSSGQYDSVIHQMKQKELQKLNSFISMIKEQLQKSNKAQTQALLKKLVEQSQFNCRSLQKQAEFAIAAKIQTQNKEIIRDRIMQPQQHYEQIDDDYRSKGAKSEEQSSMHQQTQQNVESPRIMLVQTKQSKRPITPSLQNYQKKSEKLIEQVNIQSGTIQNNAKINTLPSGGSVRQKLTYDRSISPNSIHRSDDLNVLNAYSQESGEEDPLAGLQAAERLRKKLQELNSRAFEIQNESDLLFNNSDEEQESPPLKRQVNPPLHRVSQQREVEVEDSSESSGEWQTFPKLEKLIKKLPDKERLSDDTTHILLAHLVTEFLRELGSSSMIGLFKSYAVKMRGRDKKTITIKKAVFRKAKGIKTNVAAVKQFLKGINMFVIERKPQILNRLKQPAGPSARELLKYMHPYEDDSQSEDDISMLVLPVQLFDEYWADYEKTFVIQSAEQTELERSEQDYLRRLTNIHCRAIFDCFNQSLNFERNFGEFGKPFPWKSVANFDFKPSMINYKSRLQNAYLRTIEMATSYCGIIFDKQDAPSAIMPTREQMQQMHQDRLSRTLALQVIEKVIQLFQMEKNWLFYDDEQTEILVELGQKLFDYIMRECQHDLLRLFRLRALS